MKRTIPLILCMCAVMLLSIWSIGWWAQSRDVKAQFATLLQDKPTALGKLTTGKVQVSGFPLRMDAAFSQTKGIINLTAATGSFFSPSLPVTRPLSMLGYDFPGTFTVSLSPLMTAVHLRYQGSATIYLLQPTMQFSMSLEYKEPVECTLTLDRGGFYIFRKLWDMTSLATSIPGNVRSVSCAIPNTFVQDMTNKNPLFSFGSAQMTLNYSPATTPNNSHFALSLTDHKVTTEGDKLYAMVQRVLSSIDQSVSPMAFSSYGTHSFALNSTFKMPRYSSELPTTTFHTKLSGASGEMDLGSTPLTQIPWLLEQYLSSAAPAP